MTDQQVSPAGWYPDPSGGGGQRWWDGAQWTEHRPTAIAAPPYRADASASRVPADTPTDTLWIWIIALLPLIGLVSAFSIDLEAVVRDSVENSGQPASLFPEPAYLVSSLLGWLAAAATVLFAFLDHRALVRLGYVRPFHWAWAFFALLITPLVYVIGRGVVVHRRSGRGFTVVWVAIVVSVGVFFFSLAVAIAAVANVMSTMDFSTVVPVTP